MLCVESIFFSKPIGYLLHSVCNSYFVLHRPAFFLFRPIFSSSHLFSSSALWLKASVFFYTHTIEHVPCMCSSEENKGSFHTSMLIPLMICFISVSDENYHLALFNLFFYPHKTLLSCKILYSFFLFAPLCYCGKRKLYHSSSGVMYCIHKYFSISCHSMYSLFENIHY